MKHVNILACAGMVLCGLTAGTQAMAQDCFLGEVKQFGGTYAPYGYAFADGQLLPIPGYEALFSIVGTIYGGDGRTTFALPDLRGRVAVGAGAGQVMNPVQIGEQGGSESMQPRAGQVQSGTGATVATPAPISNVQPYSAINYIVCMVGEYPSRN